MVFRNHSFVLFFASAAVIMFAPKAASAEPETSPASPVQKQEDDRSGFIKGSVRGLALRTMEALVNIEGSSKILQMSAMDMMKEVTRKETVVVRGPNYIGNGIVIPALGNPNGTMQLGNLPARRKKIEAFLANARESYKVLQAQVDALVIPNDAAPDLHNMWLGMHSIMDTTRSNMEKLEELSKESKLQSKESKAIGRSALKIYDSMTALNKMREQMLAIVKAEETESK